MKTNKTTRKSISYSGRAAYIEKLVASKVRDFNKVLERVRAKFPHSGKGRVQRMFKRALAS